MLQVLTYLFTLHNKMDASLSSSDKETEEQRD